MSLTIEQWHQRYQQQARWTQDLRFYLYRKCNIQPASKILDIGCGTGILEKELSDSFSAYTFGVDINFKTIIYACSYAPNSIYTVGDGLALPYLGAFFDSTVCHFLLLWVKNVQDVVNEMVRVTKPGGYVISMAEPDYGGRIDFPDELSQVGSWQNKALKDQGADPFMGRQLRSLFAKAGLAGIEVGILGAQWGRDVSSQDHDMEWQVLASDLENNPEFLRQAEQIKALTLASHQAQERILFVPVFYALGKVRD
jgi:ubiquinone/menaquinone biosynthesis C-methylase UbiE